MTPARHNDVDTVGEMAGRVLAPNWRRHGVQLAGDDQHGHVGANRLPVPRRQLGSWPRLAGLQLLSQARIPQKGTHRRALRRFDIDERDVFRAGYRKKHPEVHLAGERLKEGHRHAEKGSEIALEGLVHQQRNAPRSLRRVEGVAEGCRERLSGQVQCHGLAGDSVVDRRPRWPLIQTI